MLSAKHRRAEIASAQRDSPEGAHERALAVLRAASIRLWTLVRRNPDVEMPPLPRFVAARKVGTKISGFTWPRFAEPAGSSTPVGLRAARSACVCFRKPVGLRHSLAAPPQAAGPTASEATGLRSVLMTCGRRTCAAGLT